MEGYKTPNLEKSVTTGGTSAFLFLETSVKVFTRQTGWKGNGFVRLLFSRSARSIWFYTPTLR